MTNLTLDQYPTGTLLLLRKEILVGPVKIGGQRAFIGAAAYPVWEVGYDSSYDPNLKTLTPAYGRSKEGSLVQLNYEDFNFFIEKKISDLPKFFVKAEDLVK